MDHDQPPSAAAAFAEQNAKREARLSAWLRGCFYLLALLFVAVFVTYLVFDAPGRFLVRLGLIALKILAAMH